VLRRVSDQPGERHQRERREHEERDVVQVEDVVGDEREWHEG